jgi:D-amino peptidase
MRVFISADLEGISGVTRHQDVLSGGAGYPAARRWMTADVNAAVAGARAAGATHFVVEDTHGAELACNLDLDLIDPEVEVVQGFPRRGPTTISELSADVDALFLVGHHAAVGDPFGMLAHTIFGGFTDVRLNGRTVSEGEIIALAAAELDVPTVLVTGDDVVTSHLAKVVPGIQVAVVKTALSGIAGRLLPPVRGARVVREAAHEAVRRLLDGHRPMASPEAPYQLEIDLAPALDDLHGLLDGLPGLELKGRTVTASSPTAAGVWSLGVSVAAPLVQQLLEVNR